LGHELHCTQSVVPGTLDTFAFDATLSEIETLLDLEIDFEAFVLKTAFRVLERLRSFFERPLEFFDIEQLPATGAGDLCFVLKRGQVLNELVAALRAFNRQVRVAA
jgi:hypothetical protein